MRKIMLESQELVPCERCTVMLIDRERKEVIMQNSDSNRVVIFTTRLVNS